MIEKITGYWKNLESRQRRNLILVGVFFVVTVALLSWFALRPNYVSAFSNQTSATLGEISAKLDELNIPYELGADSISVPEQYVNEARMKVAMTGLPQTGAPGYSIFDESTFGMTENEFGVRNKQALEGEIQNSIQTLKGVRSAKVNIVLSEKKLFVQQQQQDAKASVVLLLEPGVKMNNDQVGGILNLVSHSVPGLLASNVSIMDQNGTRLVDEEGVAIADGGSTALSKQQQIQNQVETETRNRIRNSLEKLVGTGNAEVIVHAKVDFDQRSWTNKELKPVVGGDGATISSQKSSEESEGTTAGGPAGTPNNDVNAQPTYPTNAGGNSTSAKQNETVNKEWNTYVENGETAPYKVSEYTVSVLLNDPNLTDERRDQIKQFVSTAVGSTNDGAADPLITVAGMPFQQPDALTASGGFWMEPWFLAAVAVAMVLIGGAVYALSRRRKQAEVPVMEAPTPRMEIPSITEESENQRMRKQLEKLAAQKPEEFVNLLRTWLVEE